MAGQALKAPHRTMRSERLCVMSGLTTLLVAADQAAAAAGLQAAGTKG